MPKIAPSNMAAAMEAYNNIVNEALDSKKFQQHAVPFNIVLPARACATLNGQKATNATHIACLRIFCRMAISLAFGRETSGESKF